MPPCSLSFPGVLEAGLITEKHGQAAAHGFAEKPGPGNECQATHGSEEGIYDDLLQSTDLIWKNKSHPLFVFFQKADCCFREKQCCSPREAQTEMKGRARSSGLSININATSHSTPGKGPAAWGGGQGTAISSGPGPTPGPALWLKAVCLQKRRSISLSFYFLLQIMERIMACRVTCKRRTVSFQGKLTWPAQGGEGFR